MSTSTHHDLAPGTHVLGRYTVLGKLTQGGMAEVYLAQQQGPAGYTKLVVIKRVRPHLANDQDFVAMFVNEARLAALINHPNVVSIFDLGQEQKDWLLAMEYLDGRDMLQVGRACRQHNKAVPFDVTARIVADACAGLEHAHHLKGQDGKPLNLVHRDMSPENILITFDGAVKVVDFGIAKARDNAFRTQAGQIKGKLGYVAPEAILGKTLDARADIFALGATLYLFLCGRPAFSGSNPMEIFEKSLQPPVAPRKINPRVPEALEAICLKCLAQDRDHRYRSCGELRQALEAHLSSSGRPLGPPQLAQFMKILFPPETDTTRQRIDQLIAMGKASARPAAQAANPNLFDDDKTMAGVGHGPPASYTGEASMIAEAAVSDDRTAIVQTEGHTLASQTATGMPVQSRAPATVELPPSQEAKRSQSFGHLKSVELGDEIEADRKRSRAERRRREVVEPTPPPPATGRPQPPPTIDVDASMDMELEVEEDIEATLVGMTNPHASAVSAPGAPPLASAQAPVTREAPTVQVAPVASADALGMERTLQQDAPLYDDSGVGTAAASPRPPEPGYMPSGGLPPSALDSHVDISIEGPPIGMDLDVDDDVEVAPASQPPLAPLTQDDLVLPAVALAAMGRERDAATEPSMRQRKVVKTPAPLAARAFMFLLGAIVGVAILAGGLWLLGDLPGVLQAAGLPALEIPPSPLQGAAPADTPEAPVAPVEAAPSEAAPSTPEAPVEGTGAAEEAAPE